MKLYVKVSSSTEAECTAYAVIDVTQELLGTILKLSAITKTHLLKSVTVYDFPESWADEGDEYMIRGDELHVNTYGFWFTAYPKHADFDIGTKLVTIAGFQQLLQVTAPQDGDRVAEFVIHDGDAYLDVDKRLVIK